MAPCKCWETGLVCSLLGESWLCCINWQVKRSRPEADVRLQYRGNVVSGHFISVEESAQSTPGTSQCTLSRVQPPLVRLYLRGPDPVVDVVRDPVNLCLNPWFSKFTNMKNKPKRVSLPFWNYRTRCHPIHHSRERECWSCNSRVTLRQTGHRRANDTVIWQLRPQ